MPMVLRCNLRSEKFYVCGYLTWQLGEMSYRYTRLYLTPTL